MLITTFHRTKQLAQHEYGDIHQFITSNINDREFWEYSIVIEKAGDVYMSKEDMDTLHKNFENIKFKDIDVLEIESKSLTDWTLSEFENIGSLRLNKHQIYTETDGAHLRIKDCTIADLSNGTFGDLASQTIIDMENVRMIVDGKPRTLKLAPGIFSGTTSLQRLRLKGDIEFSNEPLFSHLTLWELEIRNNSLLNTCSSIAGITVKGSLVITDCNISELAGVILAPDIYRIDLSNNNISRIDSNVFANLTKLRKVDLSNNPLASIEGLFLAPKRMEMLNVGHTLITNLDNVFNNGEIDALILNHTPLTSIDGIRSLKSISRLSLTDCNMVITTDSILVNMPTTIKYEDDGDEYIIRKPEIGYLFLSGNNVSEDALLAIKKNVLHVIYNYSSSGECSNDTNGDVIIVYDELVHGKHYTWCLSETDIVGGYNIYTSRKLPDDVLDQLIDSGIHIDLAEHANAGCNMTIDILYDEDNPNPIHKKAFELFEGGYFPKKRIQMSVPNNVKEYVSKTRPCEPVLLYRGLHFDSYEEYNAFLNYNKLSMCSKDGMCKYVMATYTSWTHDKTIAEEYSGTMRPGISIIFSATFNPEDILIDFSNVENFDRQRLSTGNRRKGYKEVLVLPGEYQVMTEHFRDTLEKKHPAVVSKNFGDNVYQSSVASKISISQSYKNIYHDYTGALAYANETNVICGPEHDRCIFSYTFSRKSDFILVDDKTYNMMTNDRRHAIDEINQIIVERGDLDNERCVKYINTFIPKASRDVNIIGFAFKNANGENHGQYDYVICSPEKHLIRNYSSEVDWQYNPYLKSNSALQDLFKIMKLFRTSNKSHSGDLYEHTVWCYLYTEDVMEVIDDDYFASLSEVDKKFILACSLLHDIGKMSRKDVKEHSDNTQRYYTYDTIEKHPEYGAEHIDVTKSSWSSSKTKLINGINVKKILLEIDPSFTTSHVQILKQCILYHWEFGDILYNAQTSDIVLTYLGKIDCDQFNDINQQRLYVYCLLCVSISDILSRQPYTPIVKLGSADWNDVDNKVSKYIPSIQNVSKIRDGENYLSKAREMIGVARNIFSQIM
jgi:hypothetical protein